MLIILNKKVPGEVKTNMRMFGEVVEFTTSGITYEAISGHPDIFFCQIGREMIVAPNLPQEYMNVLRKRNVIFKTGERSVGNQYPETAGYCAVFSEEMLIHNLALADPVILELVEAHNRIHVNQGYCRCNLIPLGASGYITSDVGIHKILCKKGFHSMLIDPSSILLPGFPHGFIGGTAGIYLNQVFFTGSLRFHKQGKAVKDFLRDLQFEIIELYDGPLFDGGGALFIE